MSLKFLLCAAAVAAVVAPSIAAAAPARRAAQASPCFYAADVTAFRSGGPGVVYLGTADGRTVRLDTMNACRAALTSDRLAVSAPPSGRICRPVDVQVLVTDAVAGRRCPVRALRTLTADEAAALPRSMRP